MEKVVIFGTEGLAQVAHFYFAMGYSNVNKARAEKYYEAKSKGYELISYVNSKSVLWGDTKIGDNCFIFENQTIQPVVKIGNDVII